MIRSLHLHPHPQPRSYPHLSVITPTARAAKALQAPHRSLETLALQTIRCQGISVATPLTAYRCLRDVIHDILNPIDLDGMTRRFASSIRSLLRVGINLDDLKTVDSSRIQELAHLTFSYQQQLQQYSVIDEAELLWKAAQFGCKKQPTLFYGYFQPRRDELAWINTLGGDGSILILPFSSAPLLAANLTAIDFLRQQNWEIVNLDPSDSSTLGDYLQHGFLEKIPLSVDKPTPKVNIQNTDDHSLRFQPATLGVQCHIYPNLEAEVRGVLAQVKQLLSQGIAPNHIVLVAEDEQAYGKLLLDIAWEYNLPIRILYGIPLTETRLGAWLNLLLDVISHQFPFESTVKLLSHPLAQRLTPDLWEKIRLSPPQSRQDWQNLGIDLSEFYFPEWERRDNWVQQLQIILNPLQNQAKVWAREMIAFDKFQDAMVDLSRPETEIISRETFIQDLLETLTRLTVPLQPGQGGVELHNPFLLQGSRYQFVFVLGAVEGVLPAKIEPDPVLDFYERKQLAQQGFPLETALEITQKQALSFYNLLQIATESLIFSYPKLWQETPTLPSPYLTRLGLQPSPPPVLPLASWEETRRLYLPQKKSPFSDPIFRFIVHAWQVETRRESALPPDEYDGIIGLSVNPETRVFSASQLTAFGQCPFKWFASRILNLMELPEAELELSPTLRGQLYHRCLELILKSVKTREDLQQLQPQDLTDAFLQAEQDLQFSPGLNWEAQRLEHLNLLQKNLIEPNFLAPEAEILALETRFLMNYHGLKIQGIIDRVDQTEEGITVIDYKTSSTPPAGIKDETGKAKLDLQLSLYQIAIAQRYPEESNINAIYYSLKKRKPLSASKLDESILHDFIEQIQSHLQQGNFPIQPDLDQTACTYCSFDLVCRKGRKGN